MREQSPPEPYEIWIDQIRVGSGYGIEVEPPAADLIYQGDMTMRPRGYQRLWLTRWNGFAYVRKREIDPRAVVTVKQGGTTWIYDQFRSS